MQLPISVVIPTRNSIERIGRHLDVHREMFAACAEIIHCDSESTDGTVQAVRTGCPHPRLRQLTHPPGLYPSWNHAIAACTQRYVYVSTVGDDLSLNGLQRMLDAAQRTQADVVVSPPKFLETSGRVHLNTQWPVHRWLSNRGLTSGLHQADADLYVTGVLHAPDNILGSVASCLFRTAFIQARPFPTDFHGAGDSAWSFLHLPMAKCIVFAEVVSTFLLHPKTYNNDDVIIEEIDVKTRDLIRSVLPGLQELDGPMCPSPAQISALMRFIASSGELQQVRFRLKALRKRLRLGWIFSRYAWQLRRERSRLLQERDKDAHSVAIADGPTNASQSVTAKTNALV